MTPHTDAILAALTVIGPALFLWALYLQSVRGIGR